MGVIAKERHTLLARVPISPQRAKRSKNALEKATEEKT